MKTLCREQGVPLGSGGVFGSVPRFQLPLVIGEEQIDRAAQVIDAALSAAER